MFKHNARMPGEGKAPRYFRSRQAFRAWLQKHHDSADVSWVDFWK